MNTQTIEVNQMIAKYLTVEGIKLENETVVVGLDFYGMSFILTAKVDDIAAYKVAFEVEYANAAEGDNDTESLHDNLMEVLDNSKYWNRLCKIVYLHLTEAGL